MLGILVILILSWILIYTIERNDLKVLGPYPVKKRLWQLILGILFAGALCLTTHYTEALSSPWNYQRNSDFSIPEMIAFFRYDLVSVLTEELVFRGVILYILIKHLGIKKGIFISAIAFGIYHWFTTGTFGQIIPMILIFFGTATMGLAWALAYARTNSIALSLGLHLGWNYVHNTIFSKGPLGDGLLLPDMAETHSGWFSLIHLLLVPVIVLLFVHIYTSKKAESPP